MLSLVVSLVLKSGVYAFFGDLFGASSLLSLVSLVSSIWFFKFNVFGVSSAISLVFKSSGVYGVSNCFLANGGFFLVQVSIYLVSLVFSLSGIYALFGDLFGASSLLSLVSGAIILVFKSTGFAASAGLSGCSSRLVAVVSQVVSLFGASLSIAGLFGLLFGASSLISLVSLVFKSGVYAPSGDLYGSQVWFLWCLWFYSWFFKSIGFALSGDLSGF
ncbi:hypothetical protein HMPREF1544_12404 [Mucor circinelloides 1006PhL]|uniref:Uncharacterized protein n=1 Tax=Mucor circinelloides f. circinelloides (strain 1006PhL) TaxID=1220926 RepID=S2ITJ1_MUCC1|nr:hypothetical protein HMPREF1544_12404 [Mucor circinelloides 1006PhL]